jgi:hypothetical protein
MENEPTPFGVQDPGPFFHGTKADLKAGDLLEPGSSSNYGERREANYVYLTATLDAAQQSDKVLPHFHAIDSAGYQSVRLWSSSAWWRCAQFGGMPLGMCGR